LGIALAGPPCVVKFRDFWANDPTMGVSFVLGILFMGLALIRESNRKQRQKQSLVNFVKDWAHRHHPGTFEDRYAGETLRKLGQILGLTFSDIPEAKDLLDAPPPPTIQEFLRDAWESQQPLAGGGFQCPCPASPVPSSTSAVSLRRTKPASASFSMCASRTASAAPPGHVKTAFPRNIVRPTRMNSLSDPTAALLSSGPFRRRSAMPPCRRAEVCPVAPRGQPEGLGASKPEEIRVSGMTPGGRRVWALRGKHKRIKPRFPSDRWRPPRLTPTSSAR
jgi:hypothetical protein